MATESHPLGPDDRPVWNMSRRLRGEPHALILLGAMGALMGYCGWIVSGGAGIAWSVLIGLFFLAAVRHVHPDGAHPRADAKNPAGARHSRR